MADVVVQDVAQATAFLHQHALAGFAAQGQLCWAFERKQLQLWQCKESSQLPWVGHLPYPVSSALSVSATRYHVSDQHRARE